MFEPLILNGSSEGYFNLQSRPLQNIHNILHAFIMNSHMSRFQLSSNLFKQFLLYLPSGEGSVRVSVEIMTCLCLYPHSVTLIQVKNLCVAGSLVITVCFVSVCHKGFNPIPIYEGVAISIVSMTQHTPREDINPAPGACELPCLGVVGVTDVYEDLVVHHFCVHHWLSCMFKRNGESNFLKSLWKTKISFCLHF